MKSFKSILVAGGVAAVLMMGVVYGFSLKEVIKDIEIKKGPKGIVIEDVSVDDGVRYYDEVRVYRGKGIVREALDNSLRYKGYYTDGAEPLMVLDTHTGEVMRYTRRGFERLFARPMHAGGTVDGRYELVLRPGSRALLVDTVNEVVYVRGPNKHWVAPGDYKQRVFERPGRRLIFGN